MSTRENNGLVFDILKGSLQDGPGVRTTVLFKGCSLSCWWCPNPELQSPATELVVRQGRCVRCGTCVSVCPMDAAQVDEPVGDGRNHYSVNREVCIVCGTCIDGCEGYARELVGRQMTVNEVMQEIEQNLPEIKTGNGGVTFGGGEPLMQSHFLGDLLKACKASGIHTAVDTSGYTPWLVIDRVRADVDLFLYDLKFIDSDRHRQFTGLPNEIILENLRRLSALGQRIILRIPVIPGINDDAENLTAIVDFASILPHLQGIELLPYRHSAREKYERLGKPYHLTGNEPSPDAGLHQLIEKLHLHGLPVSIIDASYAG